MRWVNTPFHAQGTKLSTDTGPTESVSVVDPYWIAWGWVDKKNKAWLAKSLRVARGTEAGG
jgi:hypothetical protein